MVTLASSPSSKGNAATVRAQVRNYLAALAPEGRSALLKVRDAIRSVAPEAVEAFSYGIPAFSLDGRNFVWYAAWKHHISLYPIGETIRRAHAAEVERYEFSKGTIRFPLAEPVPVTLVTRLVKARLAEFRKKGK